MKHLRALCLLLLMLLLCAPAACAEDAPAVNPVIGEDGLLLYAPEECFAEIPACTGYVDQGFRYGYKYSYDCGRALNIDQPAWNCFKAYLQALVDSGYYEQIFHERTHDLREEIILHYVGPREIENTGVARKGLPISTLHVDNVIGDVTLYVHMDVTMNNREEVIAQCISDKAIDEAEPTPRPAQTCSECGGEGKTVCRSCSGSGIVKRTTGRETCQRCDGSGLAACIYCRGSGKE